MAKAEKATLEQKLAELEKKYGAGSIIGGKDFKNTVDVISSGSITLDTATNIGGIPIGKLIEIQGQESAGKSTLVLEIISQFQKSGKSAALIDAEHSFDKVYATALGVDIDSLIICQPDCQEDSYNIIQDLIETGDFGLIVIDSHTAMMPRKVVDGDVGDATIGLQARVNSVALGKIKPLLGPNKCTLISISQIRQNVGGYGDPNISTGGLSYKFYSDMRFKISKQLDKAAELNKTTVEVIKNKCGRPFGKAEFLINWGTGIDKMQEIVDFAVEFGFMKRGGAWYTLEDGAKLQGEENVKQFLKDNEEYYLDIKERVLSKING